MYNQYSKQKFTISKATLLTLKKKEQELNYEIDVLRREINVPNLNQKRQELERIERQIEHNKTERVHVERQKQNKAGLINKIFGEKELKPDAQNRLEKLSKEYQLLEKRRADLKEFRTSKVEYKIEQIRKKKEVLEKVSNRIKQLERRKDAVTVLKNQAALKN